MYGSAMIYVFFTSRVTEPYVRASERFLSELPVGSALWIYPSFTSRVTEPYLKALERCLNELPVGSADPLNISILYQE